MKNVKSDKRRELTESLKKTIVELYNQHDKSTEKYVFLDELEQLFKTLRSNHK